jgi:hypothetical protein
LVGDVMMLAASSRVLPEIIESGIGRDTKTRAGVRVCNRHDAYRTNKIVMSGIRNLECVFADACASSGLALFDRQGATRERADCDRSVTKGLTLPGKSA